MSTQRNPLLEELQTLEPDLLPILDERDAAARLITLLPKRYTPAQVAEDAARIWELTALYFLNSERVHEALGIFWRLYQQMLDAQQTAGRIHKGMPLVWISDCFTRLGFPVHAKRYLMLTLCEDALRENGTVSPNTTGTYFRLVWGKGLSDEELQRYSHRFLRRANVL